MYYQRLFCFLKVYGLEIFFFGLLILSTLIFCTKESNWPIDVETSFTISQTGFGINLINNRPLKLNKIRLKLNFGVSDIKLSKLVKFNAINLILKLRVYKTEKFDSRSGGI